MSRFSPYLGIVAALALGVFIAIFSGSTTVSPISTVVIPVASSTISITNSKITSTTTTTQATTVVPKKIAPPAPTSTSPVSTPTVVPPSFTPVSDATASSLRAALVNIFCSSPVGSVIHSISGSGVIIDSKGFILTNAHVAQYFLLANRGVSCVIRSGSPASDAYFAALAYISPAWLRANPTVLTEASPSGTGEYDFAFLAITKSATASALPAAFSYLSLATTPSVTGTPVVIASYGAQFIESSQITSGLFPTVVFGSVKDVFTFVANTVDVLALGGSAAAQEGSSGGGVADASGKLVGTITTSTVTGATNTRSLDAITASYIRAEYANETGQPLDLLLSESPSTAVANFASQIPKLESIITTNL